MARAAGVGSNTEPIQSPFDLTGLGAGGGSLLVAAESLITAAVGASGDASLIVTVPNAPALVSTVLHAQALVADPPANTLGVAVSNGPTLRIGTPWRRPPGRGQYFSNPSAPAWSGLW